MGIRFVDLATAWPAAISAGATWNRDLIYLRGRGIGEEAKGKGVHVILGPAVGPLGRQPKGGRNWEGFAADPYLLGEAAFQGVSVCAPGPPTSMPDLGWLR